MSTEVESKFGRIGVFEVVCSRLMRQAKGMAKRYQGGNCDDFIACFRDEAWNSLSSGEKQGVTEFLKQRAKECEETVFYLVFTAVISAWVGVLSALATLNTAWTRDESMSIIKIGIILLFVPFVVLIIRMVGVCSRNARRKNEQELLAIIEVMHRMDKKGQHANETQPNNEDLPTNEEQSVNEKQPSDEVQFNDKESRAVAEENGR